MALPLLVPLITTGLGILGGVAQRAQANRLERQNQRPRDIVNTNLLKNQAIASSMANEGMRAEAYNNALLQQQLGLATGLRYGNRSGAPFNTSALLNSYNKGVLNLNIADDQIAQQNKRLLMSTNSDLAREEQRVFNTNQMQPWMYNASRVESTRRAGNQNIIGGLSAIAQMYMMRNLGGMGGYPSTGVNPTIAQMNYGGLPA